jgi:DNA polymerase (family X)
MPPTALPVSPSAPTVNRRAARALGRIAGLLEDQGANRFRVIAYRRAAGFVAGLDRPIDAILAAGGVEGLERLPAIGPAIARGLRDLAATGRHPVLDRLRGARDPVQALRTLPGVGPVLAERLHHDFGIASVEDLEAALHDGRLDRDPWLGDRRQAALRAAVAARLRRRARRPSPGPHPSVRELLLVDRAYRLGARRRALPRIAPRRFNPDRVAWLPILHTRRGRFDYTAVFSNTARAHRLGRTGDWVVIYYDGGGPEHQATVVTDRVGPLRGRRVVRGREAECLRHYRITEEPPETVGWFEGTRPGERGSATLRAARR